jgi:hypothetical protein
MSKKKPSMYSGSGYGGDPKVLVNREYDATGNVLSESPAMQRRGGSGQGRGDLALEMMLQNPMGLAAALKPAFAGENVYSRGYEAMSTRDQQWEAANARIRAEKAQARANAQRQQGGFGDPEEQARRQSQYDMAVQDSRQRRLSSQSMKDQLYMLDQQRMREREDRSWKLAKLQELLGNAGISDTETEDTYQLVNNAGRWDKVPIRTTKTGTKKSDLLNMLMGAL